MADAGKIVITPKGAYSSTKTYEWLDEVSYNGNAYVALKTVTGVTPSDDGVNWRLFMSSTDVDANVLVPKFTEASTRINIVSGENLSTMFGKIKKWFTDLKSHAFKDLVNNLTTSTTGSALDASQGKVLQDEVDGVNRNLDIQGLLDKFDGKLDQAYYDVNNGTKTVHSDFVCNTNPISCNSGDSINFKLGIKPKNGLQIIYFNESGYVSGVTKYGTDLTFTAPSGATYFHFNYVRSGGVTPTSAGSISVFINNEIEEINASLDQLEYGETAGGKNLFDFDGWKKNRSATRGSINFLDNGFELIATSGDAYTNWDDFPITVEPNTVYNVSLISNRTEDSGGRTYIFNGSGSMLTNIENKDSFYFNSGNNNKIYIRFGATTNGSTITYTNIQIEKGSTATDYEPYISSAKILTEDVATIKKDLSTHTHNYAGSDRPGGSATYALQANKDGAGNVIDATYINKTYMRNYGAGSIAFGNNMFIGIFNGDIICSSDGQEWEVNFEPNLFSLLDNDEILLGITYGNEKFVSFSNKGCSYVSSDNGNTWTKTQTIITV